MALSGRLGASALGEFVLARAASLLFVLMTLTAQSVALGVRLRMVGRPAPGRRPGAAPRSEVGVIQWASSRAVHERH